MCIRDSSGFSRLVSQRASPRRLRGRALDIGGRTGGGSYTHLALPTSDLGENSGGAGTLKKKKQDNNGETDRYKTVEREVTRGDTLVDWDDKDE